MLPTYSPRPYVNFNDSEPRQAMLAALEKVTALQADVTDNDRTDTELMSSLGIYGPPAILFFDTNGREMRNRRVVGEKSGEEFAAHVKATFQ